MRVDGAIGDGKAAAPDAIDELGTGVDATGGLEQRRQQIVVDIGDDGELESAGQSVERVNDVGIELEPGKGIEIVGDRLRPSVDAECLEGGREAVTTDLLVGSVRMPLGLDVAFFPGLPKGFDVDVVSTSIAQNALKCGVGAIPHANQRAEHIEG